MGDAAAGGSCHMRGCMYEVVGLNRRRGAAGRRSHTVSPCCGQVSAAVRAYVGDHYTLVVPTLMCGRGRFVLPGDVHACSWTCMHGLGHPPLGSGLLGGLAARSVMHGIAIECTAGL